MPKQTTVRLPDALADEAEAVARVQGLSVNQLIIDSLTNEIARIRADADFVDRARQLLERDRELLERLVAADATRTWSGEEFFADLEPPTDDDVPITADGRRLDTPDKVVAYLDEINRARPDQQRVG